MTSQNSHRVLIVGCGQLGSRHLQAVASLPQVGEIEVVDPRPEGLDLGRQRLGEITERQSATVIRWLPSLEGASHGGDLCIVATQADVRCQLVRRVVEDLGYSSFLLEKLVTNSIGDYEKLLDFSRTHELSVWVNCQSRAHSSHRRVKAHLDPSQPIILNVIGGNHGLATNGIHVVDLFAFYDDADWIGSAGSQVDQTLHPSKRGNGMVDLSGCLNGYTDKGSRFTISYAGDHTAPQYFSVISPRYRAIIDEVAHWFCESTLESGWVWREVPFEGDLLVSNMTRTLVRDIMSNGRCHLPTLEQCSVAHRFILSELLPHFKRLSAVEGDRCPVT